jgi:hypothetical protein
LFTRNLFTHNFSTYNLIRLHSLLALKSDESHALAFLQRFEPVILLNPLAAAKRTGPLLSPKVGVHLDSAIVSKQVRAGFGGDEAEPFGIVEPLHGSILPIWHVRWSRTVSDPNE